MFDFELGEDLELIAETAKSFAQDELFPKLREHETIGLAHQIFQFRFRQPALRRGSAA